MIRGTTLLLEYLRECDGSAPKTALARACAITPMELSHLLAGRRIATLKQAVGISDATAGAVPVRSWLECDE